MSLRDSIYANSIKTYGFVPVSPLRRKDRCHRQNGPRDLNPRPLNRVGIRSGANGRSERTPNLGALSSTNRDGVR